MCPKFAVAAVARGDADARLRIIVEHQLQSQGRPRPAVAGKTKGVGAGREIESWIQRIVRIAAVQKFRRTGRAREEIQYWQWHRCPSCSRARTGALPSALTPHICPPVSRICANADAGSSNATARAMVITLILVFIIGSWIKRRRKVGRDGSTRARRSLCRAVTLPGPRHFGVRRLAAALHPTNPARSRKREQAPALQNCREPFSPGVRRNSSFGRGVPPGRPDASARRPYQVYEDFVSHPSFPRIYSRLNRVSPYRIGMQSRLNRVSPYHKIPCDLWLSVFISC